MGELKRVDVDELKVGDVVGYCKYISYGWNRSFRYPIVIQKTITRITPKRTKFVVDGMELNEREVNRLVEVNEESKRQTVMAGLFRDVQNMYCEFDKLKRTTSKSIGAELTDEELLEVHTLMKKVYDSHNVKETLERCK